MGVKRVLTKSAHYDVTLENAFELFIEEKKNLNKSNATISNYEISFRVWTRYLEGNDYSMLCKDVDDSYVYAFANHLKSETMKQSSINHYIRDIRSFLYWCMDAQYIVPSYKIKMPTMDEEIPETYTDEEIQALVARPHRRDDNNLCEWRTWAIVNWIIATGNRAGTIVEVRLGDLNFSKKGKPEITIRKTKTHKAYIIPMSTALSTVLKEYIKRWRATSDDDAYLFPSIGDQKLSVNALKQSVAKYNRLRGVEKTSVHMFRHTFAKDWVRHGGDPFRLQKMLGHSTLDMTRHYVNLFSEDLKEGFDEINPLDNIKKSASRTKRVSRTDK